MRKLQIASFGVIAAAVTSSVVVGISLAGFWRIGGYFPEIQTGFRSVTAPPSCVENTFDAPPDTALSDPDAMFRWLVGTDHIYTGRFGRPVRSGPRWNSWCMKADVGFDPLIIGNKRPTFLFDQLVPDAELRSLEQFPMVQANIAKSFNAADSSSKTTAPIRNFSSEKATEPSDVAAVLFNPTAGRALYEASRLLGEVGWEAPDFPKGSVIIKTIWEMGSWEPARGHHFIPLVNLWFPSPPLPSPISITTYEDANSERTYKREAPDYFNNPMLDLGGPKTGTCPLSLGTSVPLHCLYSHPLSTWNIKAQNTANQNEAKQHCALMGCTAILVGFHVMAKAGEGPRDWIFMTFWMRPGISQRDLPTPWDYFTANAVDKGREQEDPIEGHSYNIAFSPYLEDEVDGELGHLSNCVDCHSYAAYQRNLNYKQVSRVSDPKGAAIKEALRLQGLCLGLRPLELSDISSIAKAKAEYLSDNNHASTNGVWSVTTKLRAINSPSSVSVPSPNKSTCQPQPAR